MNDNMNFPIPNSVLEPYIKQAVSTSIVAALGDGTKLIEQAVQAALRSKVSDDGTISRYSSDNRHDLVEVVAKNRIQEVAQEVIKQMVNEMKPSIEKEVKRLIMNRHDEIAKTLVTGMISSIDSKWSLRVEIKPPKD
ncbi:TPA: hypothetical protein ACPSKZ_000708 [Legionella anisa]|uniref:hypothetical protein n=1 Tax=Legionella anisa TaxID=28082 RepID=UPI0022440540|nr:hypothetical protein [Legionella anisa]MCW8425594.1 hypothetical protein [Legionella anisa]MCW8448976.1 hypothetical protein [Legionella anisa]